MINYPVTYSCVILAMMAYLMQCYTSALSDLHAYIPSALLPNVTDLSDTIRDRLDTMASVLVRQSQALEVILANTLHSMGMSNL